MQRPCLAASSLCSPGRSPGRSLRAPLCLLVGLQLGLLLWLLRPLPASAQSPSLPAPTRRPGKNCLEEGRPKLLMDQFIAGSINRLGIEQQLYFSICTPLIRRPGVLFDYTFFEAGLLNYLSPVYDYQGAYVGISPLSILKLRAEVSGVFIWPLPVFDSAGYFPVPGYDADFSTRTLTRDVAGSAGGLNVVLSATLQAKAPLTPRLSIVGAGVLLFDYHLVGDQPFFYNSRRDVVQARSDWVMVFTSVLLLQIELTQNLALRVGASDELTYVPASGYTGNLAAGLVTLLARRGLGPSSRVYNIQPFVRLGAHTHHAFRRADYAGFTGALGISLTYELHRIGKEPPR